MRMFGSTCAVCLPWPGLLLLIWATYYTQGSTRPGFIHTPVPVVTVQTGEVAEFECQHSDREAVIGWRVNNTSVAGNNPVPGIATEKHSRSKNESNVYILRINTAVNPSKIFSIQCTAHVSANNNTWEFSNETQLIVQDNYHEDNTTQSKSSSVRIQKKNDTLDIFLLLRLEPQQESHQYKLTLQPVDDQEDENLNCMAITSDTQSESPNPGQMNDATILKVDCSLPPNRIWNYTLVTIGSNYTIVTNQELSTHDIQDIIVTPVYSSDNTNALNISVGFVVGSTAKGFLVIAYPLTDDTDTYYAIAARQNVPQSQTSVHKGLLGSRYSVSIYVIDENGLPFNRSASKPQTILFPNIDSGPEDHDNATSHPTSSCDDIKIDECTNLCVVVATNYSYQYFKPQIINVYSFRREQSAASICAKLNDSIIDDYQFAIFQYDNDKELISGLPHLVKCSSNNICLPISDFSTWNMDILYTFLLLSVPVSFVTIAVIIYYFGYQRRKKKRNKRRNDMELVQGCN